MGLFSRHSKSSFPWIQLTDKGQLNEALVGSEQKSVLFFKHSTRCGISSMVLNRFEASWKATDDCDFYLVDLLAYRTISDEMASLFQIQHQSPQLILIRNHDVIYHASHDSIIASDFENRI
jgi:bacillithiol system protein YtxJ